MSRIYGNINANEGIKRLIISNPNGMLFDGAKFTTAGDVMVTSHLMECDDITAKNPVLVDTLITGHNAKITIRDSEFNINGGCDIYAKFIDTRNTVYRVGGTGLKLVTKDGYQFDYSNLTTGRAEYNPNGVYVEAIQVDGDVLIVAMDGQNVRLKNGSDINGNLTVEAVDNVILNEETNGKLLNVEGNVNITGSAAHMVLQNADVKGNLHMSNDGGYIDLGNTHVSGDASLKTTAVTGSDNYTNFVHINGETAIDGDLSISGSENIVFGGVYEYNYDVDETGNLTSQGVYYYDPISNGSLTVGGNLYAHSSNGHIFVNMDTTAGNKISLISDKLNVLSDGDAVLKANNYEIYSKGYIGGLGTYEGNDLTSVMLNYIFVPKTADSLSYLNVDGGVITKLVTDGDASIASMNDLKVTGSDVKGDINLTAYDHRIDIEGNNVHASNINVGNETDTLKVEFEKRDYTLNFTDIRGEKVVTVNPNEEITYNLTNAPTGYNTPKGHRADDTTLLIGPDGEQPVIPTPENNDSNVNVDGNDSAKLLHNYAPADTLTQNPVNAPIAYAADLDEEELAAGIRKNVDGSVTVVRAFPVGK